MRSWHLWVFAFLLLALTGFGFDILPASSSAKFVPPPGKVLLFIGQDHDTIERYVSEVGLVPAGVMLYTSIQKLEGLDEPADMGGGVQHGGYYLKNHKFTALQIGLYMVNALDGVIDGTHDGNIRRLADWVHAAKRPVYLRIGYEFDLPDNGYDPQKYQQAYRKIVDIFRERKVNNAAFVWHTYAGFVEGSRLRWYPGDGYVDWFAVSFFDPYNQGNYDAFAKLAAQHRKPLMIAEATPRGMDFKQGEKTWNIWFKRYFEFIRRYDVRAASYINCNWEELPMFRGQGWGDARIQKSELIRDRWRKEIRQDRYLLPTMRLFNELDKGRM